MYKIRFPQILKYVKHPPKTMVDVAELHIFGTI